MRKIGKSEVFKKYNLLYVEDNKEISEEIEFFLKPKFKNFYTAYDGAQGVELFKEHRPDLIITDIQMPVMDGISMIEAIREIDSEVGIIITTAFNESDYLLRAIHLQVDGYIMKPLNFKKLLTRLEKVLEPIELKNKIFSQNSELQEINKNLDKIVKEKTKELAYLYSHDPLTGLSNFISLGEEIDTGRYENLILLDISNFATINKQYGKVFANTILIEVSKKLKEHATVNMRLFKTESDRFVFLSHSSDANNLEEFCQQIISFFDTQLLFVEGLEITINFSIGIAKITDEHFPLVNAEYALDVGKKIGSRYYHFYDESQESVNSAKETIKWISATKEMIKNEAIEPYYQPIADAKTGKIVKYEVLARANYEGKLLSPYFFIASAEKLGLVSSITRMIINKSFAYFKGKEENFSINITQRDLLDKYLVVFLEQKLALYNIAPSRVTFEILENVTVGEQHTLIMKQIQSLKSMGFEIAIDDFGIENSNFSRLLEIDFDYIKLDGLFIRGLKENKKDRDIVSAIVSLAKTLKIKTVAEYVEDKEILEIVTECGVDMAQGYLIGKPQPNVL